jgi:hypothetical protein
LGDRRARKNIKRDLKLVGYEGEIYSWAHSRLKS